MNASKRKEQGIKQKYLKYVGSINFRFLESTTREIKAVMVQPPNNPTHAPRAIERESAGSKIRSRIAIRENLTLRDFT